MSGTTLTLDELVTVTEEYLRLTGKKLADVSTTPGWAEHCRAMEIKEEQIHSTVGQVVEDPGGAVETI